MKLTGVTLLARKSKSPFAEHQKELGECGLRAAWGCLAIWWGHRNQRGWDSHPQGIILFINRHTHTYTCIWCLWRMLWTISTELQSQVEQSSELYRINMLGDCVLRHSVWLFAPWTLAHQAPLSMGILQARILEWVGMLSSRGFSQPRVRTQVSHNAGGFFTIWDAREVQVINYLCLNVLVSISVT